MFSRDELKAQLSALLDQPKVPLEVRQFAPDDFLSSSSEEFIVVCRGVKSEFESALHFWVVAQVATLWSGRGEDSFPPVDTALYVPMNEGEFLLLLSRTQDLKGPPRLAPQGRFLSGQRMAGKWYEESAVAEFEGEFWSFFWETA